MEFKKNWPEVMKRYEAWWNRETDAPLVQAYAPRADAEDFQWFDFWGFAKPGADPEALIDAYLRYCASMYFGAEAAPSLFPNLGPGVLAAYFTGYMEFNPASQTVWFEKPMPWDEVEALTFDENGDIWQYTRDIVRLAVERGRDKYITGMTDIGGNLDVLASFRGTNELLMDIITEPDRVRRMVERIDEAWLRVYRELDGIIRPPQVGTSSWMGVWCPGSWYPLQCDFAAMISPDMFQEFVMPSLRRTCDKLDYALFHLDGPGQIGHVDHLLSLERLTGIQWVPGSGAPQCESEQWLDLYRKILEADRLLVLQTIADPGRIPDLLRKLPNTGRVLLIHTFPTEQAARDFVATIPGR